MSISIAINADFETQEDAFTFLARLGREFVQEHFVSDKPAARAPAPMPKKQPEPETVAETETEEAHTPPPVEPPAPAAKKKRGRPAKKKAVEDNDPKLNRAVETLEPKASHTETVAPADLKDHPAPKAKDEIVEGVPDGEDISEAELRDLALRYARVISTKKLTDKMSEFGVETMRVLTKEQRPVFAASLRAELEAVA